MKIRYCRQGIRQILHRLPRLLRNIVPDPIDKVPNLPPEDLGVQDFADLELREAIHVERGGNFLESARERVCHVWFQEADMEDKMNVHGGRKITSERGSTNWTNDREGTKTTNIQPGGRTGCGDVASEKPHFMAK